MNTMQRDIYSSVFSLVVIGLAAFVMQRFFLPLIWAGIISIATWPLYCRVLARSGGRAVIAAILLTVLMACTFLIPTLLGLRQAIEEAPAIANFIADANTNGIAAPTAIEHIPLAGDYIHRWWLETLAQPHGLAHLFSEGSAAKLVSASAVLKSLGSQLFHRLIDFGLAFLCLFFFYKDGQVLNRQIVHIGGHWFGTQRWNHYHEKIPTAIRAIGKRIGPGRARRRIADRYRLRLCRPAVTCTMGRRHWGTRHRSLRCAAGVPVCGGAAGR